MRSKWRLSLYVLTALALASLASCLRDRQDTGTPPSLPTTKADEPGVGKTTGRERERLLHIDHAAHIEVKPAQASPTVKTEHLVIATVFDEKDQARRKRKVEWTLEGVGEIVAVDERGIFEGRGKRTDAHSGYSFTDMFEHRVAPSSNDPIDQTVIQPGQTWCIISSPVEGDSFLTVSSPDIKDVTKRQVVATVHWVDTQWQFPSAANAKAGQPFALTTHFYKQGEPLPVPNYRVRYVLLDGANAQFQPNALKEVIATSDNYGNATANLAQLQPQIGANRIGVEVLRAADLNKPDGGMIVLAKSEVTVNWQAPKISVAVDMPQVVDLSEEIPATFTVTNTGKVAAQSGGVYFKLPQNVTFVRSDPPGKVDSGYLVWVLPELAAGRQQIIHAVFRSGKTGVFRTAAYAVTRDGLRIEQLANLDVEQASLQLALSGPQLALVGDKISYEAVITNAGKGPASNVTLTVQLDPSLETESKLNPLQMPVGTLEAGQTKRETIAFNVLKPGMLPLRVTAKSAGNLQVQADGVVTAAQPQLEVSHAGYRQVYVNREGTYELQIRNTGTVALPTGKLREKLPSELGFRNATESGQYNAQTREISWDVPSIKPGETRPYRFVLVGNKLTTQAVLSAEFTANPGINQKAETNIEVLGAVALHLRVTSSADPLFVGNGTTYTIRVTNLGTLPADDIQIGADVPKQLRPTSARGAANGTIEGQRVTFPAINGLQPNQTATFTVTAQALEQGDARFHVEMRTPTAKNPIIAEEATQILPRTLNGPSTTPPPKALPFTGGAAIAPLK
ncbi:MAG TPA: hypothetical protein VKS79_17360 [Gemmataceae bacterium]|nr:hypothetical protein [Gemmataceae bacterium]